MKNLIFIVFLLTPFLSFCQPDLYDHIQGEDEYYRVVDWKFYPDSVVQLTDTTYLIKAIPFDYKDPGAIDRVVGNYVVDYVGHKFEVTDSTETTLTVYDKFSTGQAPQSSQIARCYSSVYYEDGVEVGSIDYTPFDHSVRWKLNGADNEILWRKIISWKDSVTFNEVDPTTILNTYSIFADTTNRTISVNLGNDVVMQINQESLIQLYNNTSDTLFDGRIVGFESVVNEQIAVGYAASDRRYSYLGATTENIPPYSLGLAVAVVGKLNNINTGTLSVGPVFVDTLGYFTNTPPQFPEYIYPVGVCLKAGVTDGIIQFASDGVNYRNSIIDAFDGAFRETFDFRTFSDGVNTYGVLSNPAGRDSLTLMFSTGWFDFAVPDTITLTSGTSTNPQFSYVYVDVATQTLQSSIVGFPETENAEVAKIALLDAATTQTDGAMRNQNINNHLKYDNDNGHIVHIGDRIRVLNAEWEDGVAATISGTPTNFYIETTPGNVWQMHKQPFPSHDMSAGDDVHIVNDPISPYTTTTNLNTVTTYSDGSTWNNEWQNLVLWGVGNKPGEVSHIMINLASGGYTSESNAYNDADGKTNYTIPRTFRGVGFLIGRFTVRRSPAGYTYNPSTGFLDLRGFYPNNTAGGGAGGSSGITDFTQLLDVPSSYIGFGDSLVRVNSLETGLEFISPSRLSLTDFDSTGFTLDQSQVVGLEDSLGLYVKSVNSILPTLGNVDIGLSSVTEIDSTTTRGIIADKFKINNGLELENVGNAGVISSLVFQLEYDSKNGYHIWKKNGVYQASINGNSSNFLINTGSDNGYRFQNNGSSWLNGEVAMTAGATVAVAPLNPTDVVRLQELSDSMSISNDSIAAHRVEIDLNTQAIIDTAASIRSDFPSPGSVDYISNVTESSNSISFTGVGSAFNSSIGSIAKTDIAQTFQMSSAGPGLYIVNTNTSGDGLRVSALSSGDNEILNLDNNFNVDKFSFFADGRARFYSLPTGTQANVAYLDANGYVYQGPAPSGTTDLSFSGASSPVTLQSSTGTDVTITAGTNVTFAATSSNLTINATAGSTSPGGTNGQIQYNNSGAFGGFGNWDGSTFSLTGGFSSTTSVSALAGYVSANTFLQADGGQLYLAELSTLPTVGAGYGGYFTKLIGGVGKPYFKNDSGTEYDLSSGGGTVTSVSAGNGMDFTTITTSGSVTMGTPSSITSSSTNSVTSTSHTHALGFTWGSAQRIPYMNGSANDYSYSSNLTFDGTELNTEDARVGDDLIVEDRILVGVPTNIQINSSNGAIISTVYQGDYAELSYLKLIERSSDPANPSEGNSYFWQSDGTGSGDDGDIMVKITAGGTTKTITLIDFSAF